MSGESMDASKPENKREFTRAEVRIMAELTALDKTTISGPVRDISMSGLFLPSNEPFPDETDCEVAVYLEGGGESRLRLEMKGKIMRVDSKGFAVEFVEIEVDSVEHLQNLVKYNAENFSQVEQEFQEHIGLKRLEE